MIILNRKITVMYRFFFPFSELAPFGPRGLTSVGLGKARCNSTLHGTPTYRLETGWAKNQALKFFLQLQSVMDFIDVCEIL